MSTVLRGSAKKKDAEKLLAKRPVLVLFFMEGCPHCEANKPAWDEAKKKVGKGMATAEIEASATPDAAGVSGFPTMKYVDASGAEKSISGAKQTGDEIIKELGVQPKKGGSRRRHTGRRLTHRRNRKLRHRTLRNHIALA